MRNLGIYYGAEVIDESNLVETENERKIVLEYYQNKKRLLNKAKLKISYGITIVKKEYEKDKINLEQETISKITTNEIIIKNIIEKLKINKVTPIALKDVLTDLLKTPELGKV